MTGFLDWLRKQDDRTKTGLIAQLEERERAQRRAVARRRSLLGKTLDGAGTDQHPQQRAVRARRRRE